MRWERDKEEGSLQQCSTLYKETCSNGEPGACAPAGDSPLLAHERTGVTKPNASWAGFCQPPKLQVQ